MWEGLLNKLCPLVKLVVQGGGGLSAAKKEHVRNDKVIGSSDSCTGGSDASQRWHGSCKLATGHICCDALIGRKALSTSSLHVGDSSPSCVKMYCDFARTRKNHKLARKKKNE
jgi:hypothetical protein